VPAEESLRTAGTGFFLAAEDPLRTAETVFFLATV